MNKIQPGVQVAVKAANMIYLFIYLFPLDMSCGKNFLFDETEAH